MGRGEIPAGNISKIPVAKSIWCFQTISFLAMLGWMPDTCQSTALILFYCFNFQFRCLVTNHWALYLGKSWIEMTFLLKDQLKILHIPSSSPFWMGFSCSVVFGIWVGNTCSWLGRCSKPGSVVSWHKEHSCGNRLSQPLSCDTVEELRGPNQTGKHGHISLLFSWGGRNIQSKYFVISNEKGWVNINVLNINILNTKERQIYISLVISVLTCSWWAASRSVMS